ncbi:MULTISPECIES: Uma2 family endonuclease [unclassified Nodularia (in: cyanobacteria)]|uniref:Uma2 family endonuclease n=1 Tax=unclassified Nodularia (in: cyanobacteria) TaxID=2656917 RepID=UPI0018826F46|nr:MULTISPECIES: Uma2 family endonuclease [unclassified Nodularia (in: cyanobacteria)]MBE9199816.1 Uma2 family endonuclease [Nodularia sp. LEGE 06071]MCC2692779.1 Uma2 family endonuclease [Nodularia sp. LEGE 04288]
MQNTETTLPLRLWTVEEYHRMAEAGIFGADERVELLEGKIIWMIAKGTAHRSAVGRTDKLLQNRLGNRAWVSIQDPIQLNERSEPEPDIAVVKVDPLDYADHHPTPPEVYLIIEVANSSLKLDCETKAKAYSAAGITDYWVLDVISRQLHVFREPTQEGYKNVVILAEDATISPLEFPDLQMMVLEMLPPVSRC